MQVRRLVQATLPLDVMITVAIATVERIKHPSGGVPPTVLRYATLVGCT